MPKTISPKKFLDSVRAKLHRSKGGVGLGSYGRMYADWRLLMGAYILLNIVVIAMSVNLFFKVKNHDANPIASDEDIELRVRTFSQIDLQEAIEKSNSKRLLRDGLVASPEIPSI